MRKIHLYGLLATMILILAACGGGGGGAGVNSPPSTDKPLQSTTAVITMSTQGKIPEGMALGSVGITMELPPGVTVKHDSEGAVDAGVIEVSGAAAGKATIGISLYEPATENTKGKVNFIVIASDRNTGYGLGEFVTIQCDIAVGSSVTATDFSIAGFDPFDVSRATALSTGPDGLQASFAVNIK